MRRACGGCQVATSKPLGYMIRYMLYCHTLQRYPTKDDATTEMSSYVIAGVVRCGHEMNPVHRVYVRIVVPVNRLAVATVHSYRPQLKHLSQDHRRKQPRPDMHWLAMYIKTKACPLPDTRHTAVCVLLLCRLRQILHTSTATGDAVLTESAHYCISTSADVFTIKSASTHVDEAITQHAIRRRSHTNISRNLKTEA